MPVKTILLLITVLLFTCIQANAQENSQRLLYANKVRQYTSMKRAGATLTLTGIVCIVVGLYKGNHPPVYTGPGKAPSSITNEVIVLTAAGISCTGTGIPLWTIGDTINRNIKRNCCRTSLSSLAVGIRLKGSHWFTSFDVRING